MFQDTTDAPLSLHNFVHHGERELSIPSTAWFGPTSCALAVQSLVNRLPDAPRRGLVCVALPDGVLCTSAVMPLFQKPAPSSPPQALMLLLCCRLGSAGFNASRYRAALHACFAIPQFQGLAGGGGTTSAHFFVAASESDLYYLDPHSRCQDAFTKPQKDEEYLREFFADSPRRLAWEGLNPSMALVFVCRNEDDFADLCVRLKQADPSGEAFQVVAQPLQFVDRPFVDADEPDFIFV